MKTTDFIKASLTLFDIISKFDKIIIFRHVSPDPDALGSQNALYNLLNTIYPAGKDIRLAGETPDNLKWVDEVGRHAPNCRKITPEFANGALGIVLDTANVERIDGDWRDTCMFKIDHHPAPKDCLPYDSNYTWEYIDTDASSTSEIIANIFVKVMEHYDTVSAQELLYIGIAGDTGRFMYDNATAKTLETVTSLKRLTPKVRHAINMKLNSINEVQANLVGYAYDRRYYLNDNVVSLFVPYSQNRGGHEADAYVMIGALQRLEKPEIAVVAVENEDGSYRIHLRSKFKPINKLAAKYNGGGHPLAAGAKAKDHDEVAKLFHELAEEW